MKANKMFAAALLLGAIAITSCNPEKQPPVVIPPVQSGDEVPEITKPEDGYVTIAINIPEGTECNGIAFKGTLNGADWSGADTYVGLESATVSADEAILFTPIEDSKTWYAATFKLGEAGLEGKICLVYTNDGSWQGQAINWTVDDSNTSVAYETPDGGNIKITGTNGLLYVTIGGWQSSECVSAVDYNITVFVPAFCDEEFAIELVGSFEDWGSAPVALTKVAEGKYTATISASPNAEVKVRGEGGWDKEIKGLSEETGTYEGIANVVLTEETDVIIDYSDANVYAWNVCIEG
ncbi:MAG: hypothetical protein NC038_06100 [Paludibacter sp.]|nr:hypothetical protein [Bacteroidales bacterium]MCM1069317.1 hypothetical protein [Prevotella sp.]MCM1353700.1 hypothetical protein [Bacteroides sp.]MCM1442232.1 hypothetical protein [Muribaculum sp.]MCM1482194.1 hypothetical protein [Paludibacter sp.]